MLQVGHQLGDVGVSHRDDLSHYFVPALDVLRVVADLDGSVQVVDLILSDDGQDTAIANHGIAVLLQHRIEHLDGFVLC